MKLYLRIRLDRYLALRLVSIQEELRVTKASDPTCEPQNVRRIATHRPREREEIAEKAVVNR